MKKSVVIFALMFAVALLVSCNSQSDDYPEVEDEPTSAPIEYIRLVRVCSHRRYRSKKRRPRLAANIARTHIPARRSFVVPKNPCTPTENLLGYCIFAANRVK